MIKDLKTFRQTNGLRQQDIAEAMGVAQNTVSKWERGKVKPRQNHIEKLLLKYPDAATSK